MRQTTVSGITIKYPDAIGFAFMPCLIKASGTNAASMEATITRSSKSYTYSVETFSNGCIMDFREYVQALFDGLDFEDIDYTRDASDSHMGDTFTVALVIKNSEDKSVATFTFSTFYVWGAMRAGETWNATKKLTWFKHFPFSIGQYFSKATSVLLYGDNKVMSHYIDITKAGMFEFTHRNFDANAKLYEIKNYGGAITQATFDASFDFTFYLKTSSSYTTLATITVDDTEEGIYLRWVDRHGFYRYWLFTQGDEERAISSNTSYLRNNDYDDTIYGYYGANGRRQGYEREDTIPLCAPLVDSDTYEMLQDLASSPVVDMYLGNNKWQSVTIKAGTYTKTTDILQDFVCNLVLNNTNIQQL